MLAPKLFITLNVGDTVTGRTVTLADGRVAEVDMNATDMPLTRSELLARAPGSVAVLCMLSDKIDKEFLDAAGDQLRVVATLSVGVDHIDLDECEKRGIKVGNTPDVLTNSTAELTVGLLLNATRRLAEAATEAKEGRWATWTPFWLAGRDVAESTVGIVGLGRIGRAVLERLRPFQPAALLYTGRTAKDCPGAEFVADKHEFLSRCDIVIATCALTDGTRNFFDRAAFASMQPHAYLVNVSRGACLDQDALVDALKASGTPEGIAGAALDVTSPEPLPADHALFSFPNCFITPHIGSATTLTRTRMIKICWDNMEFGLLDKPMVSQVSSKRTASSLLASLKDAKKRERDD